MLENKLIKKNFINKNIVRLINKKFSKDITEAINYSKKSNFSKKLNIYNLNYNSVADYKKEIIKVDKNLKTSILSKKKIIGY